MPAKNSGSTKKTRRPSKLGAAKSGGSKRTKGGVAESRKESPDPDAKRFVRDLLIRGEAVMPAEDGSLPPGATHTIKGEDEDGQARVERERFSLY